MKLIALLLLAVSTALSAAGPGALSEPKVVLVVIDGVRDLEIEGRATDDSGKRVPVERLFPALTELRKGGVYLPSMHISNPTGISLPAYADIFAGRRQEKIVSNEPPKPEFHSHYPTIFQAARHGLNQGADAVALLSSWGPLCKIAITPDGGTDNDFFRSCGWDKARDIKPEVYEGSRTDMDSFLVLSQEIPKRHPRFAFLHFGDADEEGHLHKTIGMVKGVSYGIHNYHKALTEADYYIGRLWKMLQADPFYKDSTYLIVTTDHGRDNVPDPLQWWDHGECVNLRGKLCSGCQHVFAIAVGPGLKQKVVTTPYTHADLAPTVARILGVPFPTAKGAPIPEIAPLR